MKRHRGVKAKRKRLGRGNASQKGTMSGRGGKGQTARSGGGRRSAIRALRPSLLKIPKLRGFRSIHAKPFVVTLKQLDRLQSSEPVTSEFLKGQGCIPGSATAVKIVGTGTLTKKLTIQGCGASASARAAIEKAGGSVTG